MLLDYFFNNMTQINVERHISKNKQMEMKELWNKMEKNQTDCEGGGKKESWWWIWKENQ